MNDLRKAAEQALKALEKIYEGCGYVKKDNLSKESNDLATLVRKDCYFAMNSLRQALDDTPPVKTYAGGKPNYCTPDDDLQNAIEKGTKAWADVPDATEWVEELRGNDTPEVTPEVPCKTDPRAPHGFNRNASFDEDRYVCDCEFWEPDVDAVNISEERIHKTDKSIHEPVAIVNAGMGGIEWLTEQLPDDTPLYAAPPKQEYQYEVVAEHADGTYTTKRIPKRDSSSWVGLTNEEIDSVWKTEYFNLSYELPRAIEAKLKEKNT